MSLPVPSPSTAVSNERVSTALWDSDVRDGVNFLLNPPIFKGALATAQSIPSGPQTVVGLDAVNIDSYNGHSTTVNNDRYTVQVAGWYRFIGTIWWPTGGTGRRVVQLFADNFTIENATELNATVASTAELVMQAVGAAFLVVGNWISLCALQTSGSPIVLPANAQTTLEVQWMHA